MFFVQKFHRHQNFFVKKSAAVDKTRASLQWRKFFIKKGCACSSCGKAKGCSRKPQQENELRHSITFEK